MTSSSSPEQVETRTPGGSIVGQVQQDGTCRFLGIRFASAERLSPPVDVMSWPTTINAFEYGPICPQTPGTLEKMLGSDSSTMSEDCLSLNVFTPGHPAECANMPVLVWIHGGAYTNGAGSLLWYDGARLASRGCVVVTINYRLGALGFLGESNLGTLDQVSALRWVSRNISAFGGNPSNVTIFGESAGGSAVVSLMASPDAHGLFHRVWAMSPSLGQLRGRERALEVEQQFFDIAGISDTRGVLNMTVDEILGVQEKVLAIPSDGYDIFAPTAGGPGLGDDIFDLAGRSPVPLVIGTTRDENKLFSMLDPVASQKTESDWVAFLEQRFGARAGQARDVYQSIRPGESPAALISAVLTDIGFRQRAQRLAEHRSHNGCPTWMYWFTWQTPAFGGVLGSCHALDIPFAFDNLGAPGADFFTGDGPERAAIAQRFSDEIVRLATHGHPSWAQFEETDRSTLVIDATTTLASDPEAAVRSLFQ